MVWYPYLSSNSLPSETVWKEMIETAKGHENVMHDSKVLNTWYYMFRFVIDLFSFGGIIFSIQYGVSGILYVPCGIYCYLIDNFNIKINHFWLRDTFTFRRVHSPLNYTAGQVLQRICTWVLAQLTLFIFHVIELCDPLEWSLKVGSFIHYYSILHASVCRGLTTDQSIPDCFSFYFFETKCVAGMDPLFEDMKYLMDALLYAHE